MRKNSQKGLVPQRARLPLPNRQDKLHVLEEVHRKVKWFAQSTPQFYSLIFWIFKVLLHKLFRCKHVWESVYVLVQNYWKLRHSRAEKISDTTRVAWKAQWWIVWIGVILSQIIPYRKPCMPKTWFGQQSSFQALMGKARIKDKYTGDFS